jgi:HK97 family phage major capsid protein
VAGAGAYLVATENLSFVNTLAKRSILGRLPVQQHQELRANQTIGRMTGAHTVTWLGAESSQVADGQSAYGQASMSPKSVAATVVASRMMLLQGGPMAEAFLNDTLATALAEAVDAAMIVGSGNSGQPLGLTVMSGTDSRAGTSFALADAAAMLKVADGYAQADTLAWVAGVDAAEDLRTRPKVSGGEIMLLDGGRMLDQPVIVSRSAPAAGLVVMLWGGLHFGQWGALEVAADPYTYASTGRVIIRALWRVDFAVDAPGQVAVATALT